MNLIVGLGNPGPEYQHTRHNIGFHVLQALAQRHGLTGAKRKFASRALEGRVADTRCLLLQPMTYMNRSGRAVAEASRFYKLQPEQILVIVDDVALPCGKIRLRKTGSAGGHNGLADIERHLGTRDYPRLRMGIDTPGKTPQRDYVLGKFSPDQLEKIAPAIDHACDAIECWLRDDIDKAMSLYNAQ